MRFILIFAVFISFISCSYDKGKDIEKEHPEFSKAKKEGFRRTLSHDYVTIDDLLINKKWKLDTCYSLNNLESLSSYYNEMKRFKLVFNKNNMIEYWFDNINQYYTPNKPMWKLNRDTLKYYLCNTESLDTILMISKLIKTLTEDSLVLKTTFWQIDSNNVQLSEDGIEIWTRIND